MVIYKKITIFAKKINPDQIMEITPKSLAALTGGMWKEMKTQL